MNIGNLSTFHHEGRFKWLNHLLRTENVYTSVVVCLRNHMQRNLSRGRRENSLIHDMENKIIDGDSIVLLSDLKELILTLNNLHVK